ncbi:MAG: LPS export ABC transporter permease LptG [Betaproteobacteria bacterium]|jgi:lipopolysaccharide export system permease protein
MNEFIFRRYIGGDILRSTSLVLIGFLSVFLFFDLLGEISEVGVGGYQFEQALSFVLLGLPSRAVELAPIAALIGTLWALSQSAVHSEFTVFRVSGLLPGVAIRSILYIGFPMILFTAAFSELVAPSVETFRGSIRDSGGGINQMRSGLWLRDSVPTGQQGGEAFRFVNAVRLTQDRDLQQVTVYEFDTQQRLVLITEARVGQFLGESSGGFQWVLRDVRIVEFLSDGGVTQRERDQLVMNSSLSIEMLGALVTNPDRMSSLELYRYIQYLKQNKQQSERYEIAFWKRLVYPWVIWVMMLLALPAAFLQARSGAVGTRVFAGILIGVAFHLLNSLFSHLGVLTTWPAPLMALFPSLMALGLAGFFLYWVQYR